MRVKELIERLQQFDPELPVAVDEANEVGLCEASGPVLVSQYSNDYLTQYGERVVIAIGRECADIRPQRAPCEGGSCWIAFGNGEVTHGFCNAHRPAEAA